MPSPFPGMNPYLEQADCWEDFHRDYLTRVRAALNPLVGPNYIVKLEARLTLHERSANERGFLGKADVGIAAIRPAEAAIAALPRQAAPVQLMLPAVERTEQLFVEIQERKNRRLVTAIELLSPSNKDAGGDRDVFLAKRQEVLGRGAHYVEIDLRRGGQRPQLPVIPPCDYYVLVSRAEERPRLGLWPIALRDRLPKVPVPLAAPDPDVFLDLQEVLAATYDESGYDKYIYSGEPEPPLPVEDAAWAWSLVTASRKATEQ